MRSERPKPLHLLCGRAMLLYVLDSLADCSVDRVVIVVGHGAERVTKKLQDEEPDLRLEFVEQRVQRGTGDAVSVGLTGLPDDADADDAARRAGAARRHAAAAPVDGRRASCSTHRESGAACTILTGVLDDPTGYGRIVRGKDDRVARIVEELDATPEERAITEWNTSIYCFRRSVLAPALRRLQPQNAQGEYYLTDVVAVLHDAGYPVATVVAADAGEAGRHQRPGAAGRGRGRAAPAHERARGSRRASRWSTRPPPTSTPPSSWPPTSPSSRARSSRAAPSSAGAPRSVPARGWSTASSAPTSCSTGSPATTPRSAPARSSVPTRSSARAPSIPDGTVTGPFYTAPGAE